MESERRFISRRAVIAGIAIGTAASLTAVLSPHEQASAETTSLADLCVAAVSTLEQEGQLVSYATDQAVEGPCPMSGRFYVRVPAVDLNAPASANRNYEVFAIIDRNSSPDAVLFYGRVNDGVTDFEGIINQSGESGY